MRKKYVLIVIMIVAMGMTACSKSADTEAVSTETQNTEPQNIEVINTELTNIESPHTESGDSESTDAESASTELATDIDQGDPLVALVDSYENHIIVLRDLDDEDIVYYFSTKDAEVVEGDSPIAAGDIVEIIYQGLQGDKEHPGIAVKVVAESEMYR